MATETQENEASSLGDEWQWINNETAEVLRATVEDAFIADPRKNWSAEELARWIRDVALVSAKKNVWDHAAALGEFLVNGLGYVTGEDYMSMDLALMITIGEDEEVPHMMNDASIRTVHAHRYMAVPVPGPNYPRNNPKPNNNHNVSDVRYPAVNLNF